MTLQGFFTSGYFLEDVEVDSPNLLKTAERKKILSNIESLGLLSAAEKAGLSLSKVSHLHPLHMLFAGMQPWETLAASINQHQTARTIARQAHMQMSI